MVVSRRLANAIDRGGVVFLTSARRRRVPRLVPVGRRGRRLAVRHWQRTGEQGRRERRYGKREGARDQENPADEVQHGRIVRRVGR